MDSRVGRPAASERNTNSDCLGRHSCHLLPQVLPKDRDSGQGTLGGHRAAVTGIASAEAAGKWFSAVEGRKGEGAAQGTGLLRPQAQVQHLLLARTGELEGNKVETRKTLAAENT